MSVVEESAAPATTVPQCALCRRNDTSLYPLDLAPVRGGIKSRIFGAKLLTTTPIGEYPLACVNVTNLMTIGQFCR